MQQVCSTQHLSDFSALFNGGGGGNNAGGGGSGDSIWTAEFIAIFSVSWGLLLLVLILAVVIIVVAYKVPWVSMKLLLLRAESPNVFCLQDYDYFYVVQSLMTSAHRIVIHCSSRLITNTTPNRCSYH